MSRIFKTRRLTVLVGVIAAIGITAAAFAYWTTTGSGTGSGTAGSSTALTVTQTSTVSGLIPGGAATALDFDVDNTASHNQYLGSVVVAITGVTGPNIDATHPCDASDFTLVQPTAINTDLTPGNHSYSPSGASLALDNTAGNQDGCKNATVALSYTA